MNHFGVSYHEGDTIVEGVRQEGATQVEESIEEVKGSGKVEPVHRLKQPIQRKNGHHARHDHGCYLSLTFIFLDLKIIWV